MIEQLINFLIFNKEIHQAISILETLEKYSTHFYQFDEIAKLFFKIKEYEKAISPSLKAYRIAITDEEKWISRYNLINVYNHANYPELAIEHIEEALKINPKDVDTILEKAYSKFLLDEKISAEHILRNVLENNILNEENKIKIEFNLGTYHLYRDEFQKGLELFLLKGKQLKFWQQAKLPFEYWKGNETESKNIIVFAEAGIGDEIINVRFMTHLKNKGFNPIWLTDRKEFVDIFNRNGFVAINNISEIGNPNDILWTFSMCVPLYLNLEYSDLWNGSYLSSSKEYDKKYEWINSSKPKIGIRWQGNPEYDQDLHRSVPFKEIYNSLKNINGDFYSLQKDNGVEELMDYQNVINMESYMDTFEDTLSIINKLDVVITSCTSIAHASAAMGKRTIILVPISAYYTWSHSGDKSPWYGDNVTLLRQKTPRSWKEPLEKLENIMNYEFNYYR